MVAHIIRDLSYTTAVGNDATSMLHALDEGLLPELESVEVLGQTRYVARVSEPLPAIAAPEYDTASNRLLLACLSRLSLAWKDVTPERLGVVIGTSNAGIEEFVTAWQKGTMDDMDLARLEMGGPALFLAAETGAKGPAYCISTACSSSAKAFASAARLLDSGLCDAVIVGGTDELCHYTLGGFEALHLLADGRSKPFSPPYAGINHGEAAALFLMMRGEPTEGDIILAGYGESSDAHHPTTPEPSGEQAAAAMRQALGMAGLSPADIDYLNLHGTGTEANDTMELTSIALVFGEQPPPCGSTKPYTGHTLGAAGAVEAAICALLLQRGDKRLPAHPWLSGEKISAPNAHFPTHAARPVRHIMSNSFAFGGCNASIILSRV